MSEPDTLLGFPIEQTDMGHVGEIVLIDWNTYQSTCNDNREIIVNAIRVFYSDFFNNGMAFGL